MYYNAKVLWIVNALLLCVSPKFKCNQTVVCLANSLHHEEFGVSFFCAVALFQCHGPRNAFQESEGG